jgi:cobalt/nickel transport system permease protein
MVSAFATSIQLWMSATSRLGVVLPAMMGVHALIGLGEALITASAVGFILRVRPQLLREKEVLSRGNWAWIVFGVLISIVVVFVAPLASANPDGLEMVATELGFANRAGDPAFNIFPEYIVPILGETPLSTIFAGLIGVSLLIGISLLIARVINRRTMHSES